MNNFKKNLIKSITNIDEKVALEKWKFSYDKISDILYFSPENKKISKDSVLMPLKDDFISLRVSTKGDIECIVVEDFKGLFLDDCPEFEPILKIVNKRTKPLELKLFYKALFSGACIMPKRVCAAA